MVNTPSHVATHPATSRSRACVGMDTHDVSETVDALTRFGMTYVLRFFSDEEARYVTRHPSRAAKYLAERFAAREAILKLLELGDLLAHRRDIKVAGDGPRTDIILTGQCLARAHDRGFSKIHLSLASTTHIAVAVAVADQTR